MNYKKYIMVVVLMAGVVLMACRDESLYPLPYDDRTSGAYLRMYKITSNTWDVADLANSGFEVVYESVDKNGGSDLEEIDFYVTHRTGATGLITREVLIKTVPATSFAAVAEPTFSEYLRSAPIRITATETMTALATLSADPDGNTCTGIPPDVCALVAYPGTVVPGDQIIYRWKIKLKDGQEFTVRNPQVLVNPAFGNAAEANLTPNITGGLFYNAPSTYTMLVRDVNGALPANAAAYTGTYRMAQVAIWSPVHSPLLHQNNFPSRMNEFLFGNSLTDSTQTVTISMVPGGLYTERQFTCKYKGQDITMRINLEQGVINQFGSGLSAAALATVQAAPTGAEPGLGFPAGTTTLNLGTVFVPILNSGLDCSTEREFYLVTPLGGAFGGTTNLAWGLPRRTFPNRGFFRNDQDGLTAGQVFSISVDEDVDEYGRRNGYCGFYRRVYLTLTKL